MIASLQGKVKDIFSDFVIVEVNSVGYKVEGIGKYLDIGAEVEVYIYTHYSQQDTRLFGFLERDEFLLFEELLRVSGVGPKTAAALINNVGAQEIKSAILKNEPKTLTGNGVGTKTAQKIILELASRISKSDINVSKMKLQRIDNDLLTEVEDALLGLGYNKQEIINVLAKFEILPKDTTEGMLRKALNILSQKQK
jgi:Holliday junction DNA helicase RuvA